ncbi:kelch repeat-containing protein [Sorangium sp. So ce260]|uniref:Kelch repeat-containing protein n=1 Tax=Sorangium sp. So ce260 TaxID=3133291 RepID=UPI003F63D686
MPLPSSRSRRASRQSPWLAAALLLGGCGSEPEDTSAAALRLRFPEHADAVLSAREAFAVSAGGFRLAASEPGGAWVRSARPEVELPREGSGVIRFRLAGGGEIGVRELGAAGEGAMAEGAVSYRRAGGTSFWTATEGGVEEWLLLEAGVARGGEVVAAWEVEGAQLRARGAAVELVDEARGAPVLRVTAPRAHAASGRAVAPALRVRGARIELSVDMGDAGGEAVLVDPAWEPAGSMSVDRTYHTATLLPGDQVLLVGGRFYSGGSVASSAELYDPTSDTWSPAAPMGVERVFQCTVLLPNGKVLVAGGNGYDGAMAARSAELYDPASDTWAPRAPMLALRAHATAALLPSGKVLVASGHTPISEDSAELYDPELDTWTPTAPMNIPRYTHQQTVLESGEVLVTGGYGWPSPLREVEIPLDSAELYDPASGTWRLAAPMRSPRIGHTSTLLSDGKVLVAGGVHPDAGEDAEVYDPASDTWTPTGPTSTLRILHSATLLPSGKVLAAGGIDGRSGKSTELYDPVTNTWTPAVPMVEGHQAHTATLLPSGQVLVAGTTEYSERYTSVGVACASDADCALAVCVDGVCCDSPCTEPCHTCALGSSPGSCVPQPKGSDLRGECAHQGCDGACDGFGACAAVPREAECAPAECIDDTHSRMPIVCPADGVACPDSTGRARAVEDCSPYGCEFRDGKCKQRCSSPQDCAPGFACSFGNQCIRAAPAVSRGCGAARGAAVTSGGSLTALLLALLAAVQRRWRGSWAGRAEAPERT